MDTIVFVFRRVEQNKETRHTNDVYKLFIHADTSNA